MGRNKKIEIFILNLRQRLSKEMPKVRKEIELYEKHLAADTLIKNPVPSPQFNE